MKPCTICKAEETVKWTINRGGEVSIVDLCARDEELLLMVFNAGRVTPKRKQRTGRTPVQRVSSGRKQVFEPLDWEPPDDRGSST